MKTPPTFHLGLTMAGAVTAGAYTAGVMDYLLEILDKLETAQREGFKDIHGTDIPANKLPNHKVVIDVMGGASAGGMATMLAAAYAIRQQISPVKTPEDAANTSNLLYRSWVDLFEKDEGIIKQILDTSDLDNEGKVLSLLNSDFLEDIANQAFPDSGSGEAQKPLPEYISPDMEILLSHSMLRGIPLEIDFKAKESPDSDKLEVPRSLNADQEKRITHTTYEHFMMSHFKLGTTGSDEEGTIPFDLGDPEVVHKIRNAAISTGAFPIGLKFREFEDGSFSQKYLEKKIWQIVKGDFSEEASHEKRITPRVPESYTSVSIDGGAINNEPLGEVASILKKRGTVSKENNQEDSDKDPIQERKAERYKDIGLVMIDPFPDRAEGSRYCEPDDLIDAVPKIIQTLWNQSKVKRRELLDSLDESYYKGVIYPVKREGDEKLKYPLASASFYAFGGLFSKEFRIHDFFLGRDNARNFFGYFFSLPYEKGKEVHPIHAGWPPEAIDAFLIKDKTGKTYLPIIPDMNTLGMTQAERKERSKGYTVEDLPSLDPQEVLDQQDAIRARLGKIVKLLFAKMNEGTNNEKCPKEERSEEQEDNRAYAEEWMDGKIGSKGGGWNLLGNILIGKVKLAWYLFQKPLLNRGINLLFKIIIYDLADRGLIRRKDKKL